MMGEKETAERLRMDDILSHPIHRKRRIGGDKTSFPSIGYGDIPRSNEARSSRLDDEVCVSARRQHMKEREVPVVAFHEDAGDGRFAVMYSSVRLSTLNRR